MFIVDPYTNSKFEVKHIPIREIDISPFQREISNSIVNNLMRSIEKIGFITPIVVTKKDGKYLVIDGQHRLVALKNLLSPDVEVPCVVVPFENKYVYNFSLNVEKSPNVKDKSKQVYKMFIHELSINPDKEEFDYSSYFEKPYYITCGICINEIYDRFSPGIYERLLDKIDFWLNMPLKKAYEERKRRANKLNELNIVINQKYNEIGINNPLVKGTILNKAIQKIYGIRVRTIDDDFFEAIDKIKSAVQDLSKDDIPIF